MPLVVTVDPDDAALNVRADTPVVVRLQREDSSDYAKTETSQADFAAGVLTDVVATAGDALELGVGSGSSLCLALDGTANAYVSFASNPLSATDNLTVELIYTPGLLGREQVLLLIGNTSSNGFYVEFNASDALQIAVAGVAIMVSNYTAVVGTTARIVLKRASGIWYLWVNGVAKTLTNNTSAMNAGASVYMLGYTSALYAPQGKIDEVRLWSVVTANTDITSEVTGSETGLVGAWHCNEASGSTIADATSGGRTGSLQSGVTWSTNSVPWGAGYVASGNRVSPAYSLASVGMAGEARIEWDADTPAGTAVTLKARINGGSFAACTNGGLIPGISPGDDLSAATITLEEDLATTDTGVTPSLTEVRLIFMGVDPADVEVDINGVASTEAAGTLEAWNTLTISGGAIVEDHRDVWVVALAPWYVGPGTVTVLVKLAGTTVSTTTFDTAPAEDYAVHGGAYWLASTTSMAWKYGDVRCSWDAVDIALDLLYAPAYYEVLEGPASTVWDAYYWVAHRVLLDASEGVTVGKVSRVDASEAVTVRGSARQDAGEGVVVQGWARTDAGEAVAVANPAQIDAGEGVAVGQHQQLDAAEAATVRQVNRKTMVELKTISPDTDAVLDSLGITVS